jgi:hypothetical protein
VQQASRRAGLRVERVVQSVAVCFGHAPPSSQEPLPVGDQVERPVAHAAGEIGP